MLHKRKNKQQRGKILSPYVDKGKQNQLTPFYVKKVKKELNAKAVWMIIDSSKQGCGKDKCTGLHLESGGDGFPPETLIKVMEEITRLLKDNPMPTIEM